MTTEFWLGIAISVPVGIATALLTPPVQGWLDRHSKHRGLRKTRDVQAEFKRISNLKEHPDEFTHYLLYVSIQIAFISAIAGILAGVLFALAMFVETLNLPFRAMAMFFLCGQIIATLGTLLVIGVCRKGLNTWYRVKNFDDYKAAVSQFLT